VQASIGADLVSHFMWRGEQDGNAAIQPEFEVRWRGLYFGLWGSYGLVENNGEDWTINELDVNLGWRYKGFSIELSDEFVTWGDFKPKYFYFKRGSNHVLEANVGYDFGFLELKWYTNISGTLECYEDEHGNLKHAYASYFEAKAPFRLAGFDWEGTLGIVPYNPHGWYDGCHGFCINQLAMKVTKEIPITKSFHLPIYVNLIANPATERFYFTFGLHVGID